MAPPDRGRGGRRALAALGTAVVLLLVVQAAVLADLRPGVLALQLAGSARRFGEIVHQWSPEQLARYRAMLAADSVMLLAYAAFGWRLARTTATFAALPRAARLAAAALLPLAALADAGENVLHAWLTAEPRFGFAPVYAAALGCAAVKWLAVVAFGVLLAWGLVAGRDEGAGDR